MVSELCREEPALATLLLRSNVHHTSLYQGEQEEEEEVEGEEGGGGGGGGGNKGRKGKKKKKNKTAAFQLHVVEPKASSSSRSALSQSICLLNSLPEANDPAYDLRKREPLYANAHGAR